MRVFAARLARFHLQEPTSGLPVLSAPPLFFIPPPSLIPSSSHLCHDYTFASLTCDDVTTFWQPTLPIPSNSPCRLSEKQAHLSPCLPLLPFGPIFFKVLIFFLSFFSNAFPSEISIRGVVNEIDGQRDFGREDDDLVLHLYFFRDLNKRAEKLRKMCC